MLTFYHRVELNLKNCLSVPWNTLPLLWVFWLLTLLLLPGLAHSADTAEEPDGAESTPIGWKISHPLDWNLKKFSSEQWTSDSGLPLNFIQCIAQTPDGYIWAGTSVGLARFDGGQEWEVFNRHNTPNFRDDNWIAMTTDVEGFLWIGTPSALYRVSENAFEEFPLEKEEGIRPNQVDRLIPLDSGGLLIPRKDRIQLFKDGVLKTLIDETQVSLNVGMIRDLQMVNDNSVVVGGHNGIFRINLKEKQWAEVELKAVSSDDWSLRPVLSFFMDKSNNFWLSDAHHFTVGGVRQFQNVMEFDSDKYTPWFTRVCHTSGDLIWYSDSIGGLYWIDTDDPTEAVSMKIMETFIVRNLLEDYEGNIWVGTEEAGLFRLRPHVFQTLSQKGRPSDISV